MVKQRLLKMTKDYGKRRSEARTAGSAPREPTVRSVGRGAEPAVRAKVHCKDFQRILMNERSIFALTLSDYVKMYIVRSGKTRIEAYERQLRSYVPAQVSKG